MCTGARVSERERERQLLLPAPATSTRCVPVCALLLFYSHHTAPLPHGMTLALFFFAAWPSPEPFPMYVGPCQCLRRSSAPRFSLLYYYYYCFFFFSPFLPSWLPPLSAVPVLFPRLATAAMALHRGDVPWMYCNGGTVPLARGTRGTPTFLRFSFFFFPQRHNRVSGTVTRLFSTLSPARVANTRPRSCMYIGRGCLCGCGAAAPSCVWKGDVAVRSGSLLAKHPTFFPRPWSAVRVHSLRCCAYVYYFSLSFTAPLFSPLPGVFASYTRCCGCEPPCGRAHVRRLDISRCVPGG